MRYRRATAESDDPGRLASATIRRLASSLKLRRRSVAAAQGDAMTLVFLTIGLAIWRARGLSLDRSRGYRPPRLRPYGILTLQLRAPVAEAL